MKRSPLSCDSRGARTAAWCRAASFGATLLLAGRPARAEPPPPRTPATRTTPAQVLFYEARTLMQEGRYALACPKLEESLRLEHGLGTEFNLADCNERLGKLASAWSGFTAVADAARAQNQSQREKLARDRARSLEPRVPMVTIEVTHPGTPGLELKRDGLVIGGASSAPTPIDPGPHRLVASAPGRRTWEGSFNATEGKRVKVVVPTLAAAPPSAVVASTSAIVPTTSRFHAAAAPPSAARVERAHPMMSNTYFPEPVVDNGRGQRIAGIIVGAAGLAGLGVAAGFGLDSIQKGERSKRYCEGNLCNEQGIALRERAMNSGDVATVATIAGATAVLGGLALVLTAPRASSPDRPRDAAASIRAVPHVASNGGGLSIQGSLP